MRREELLQILNNQNSPRIFQNVDFSNLDLTDLDLSSFHFKQCSFLIGRRTLFRNAFFDSCHFLSGAQFQNSNFVSSTVRDCTFDGPSTLMQGSAWEGSKIARCTFSNLDLSMADFHRAEIDSSTFSNCDLDNACFPNSKITSSTFSNIVRWTGTSFTSSSIEKDTKFAHCSQMSWADFSDSVLVECPALFDSCNLYQSIFHRRIQLQLLALGSVRIHLDCSQHHTRQV